MKAIHNILFIVNLRSAVVLYPKDTEKWKQFTTIDFVVIFHVLLFCIPKILKNESNSQQMSANVAVDARCFVSQRYWKMKAIHNQNRSQLFSCFVVLYPKDTEKWKQFTTYSQETLSSMLLFCIPKILKNESNSQHIIIRDK